MSHKKKILQSILDQGMLPLFYLDSLEASLEVVRTLYKAGIRALEYTNRGEKALENFAVLKKTAVAEMPGLWMGIGTVKTVKEAKSFIAAGADFIVSPIVNPKVAVLTEKEGMLWIPGCMTPTEISVAQEYGAAVIKIFPANILGPEFVQSIRELFNGQLFMPTGGVELDLENIRSWFRAGVCAVGMGSRLIGKEILKNKDYDTLYKNTLKALELVREGRQV
ncbi:MAG: bifunctional 4-hydroxy-2-oxoglutarate aldolase/2-dehydro-3-deoxy-phosphogluconate aldolase [Puia sp.]|nr:bifunctional 4-hydroxy-2-oxoglutarate aldolase/2-dehydro-3-deoxy-phosphogluconate aldolase [Puia sp.]